MDDDDRTTGLTSYQGPKADRVRDVLSLLREKCRYRAMVQELQKKIDLALPHLDREQTHELLALMAEESDMANGADIVQIRQEAEQAAQGIHPCDVRLNRATAKALRAEVVRRLSTGHYCPPTELLVAEAVRNQFERP
jgi:hypothetical protein